MCGILGLLEHDTNCDEAVFLSALSLQHHRGPDNQGYVHLKSGTADMLFGHRRLSIIDLSEHAHQPFSSQDERYTLIYNGEVYNFRSIRKELENLGESFITDSDTEVVLKAYEVWGELCVDRFIGMFSFAIFDSQTKKIVLFRDRFGVKPLYLYKGDSSFVFASELKSLRPFLKSQRLSQTGLTYMLKGGYIPAPYSIFEDVQKALPGYVYTYDIEHKTLSRKAYWSLKTFYQKPKLDISENEALDTAYKLLVEAVSLRLVSDVPVGVFLSSGFDSTLVTAIIAKELSLSVTAFTIGFDDECHDESALAAKIAETLGVNHHVKICSEKEFLNLVQRHHEVFDEPFGDSSSLPTILVSSFAREQVRVCLSADGGDELCGGYSRYFSSSKIFNLCSRIPVFTVVFYSLFKMLRGVLGYSLDSKLARFEWMKKSSKHAIYAAKVKPAYFSDYSISKLLNSTSIGFSDSTVYYDDCDLVAEEDQSMFTDAVGYMTDDILVKVDRASMSVSLESREPLLDHRLFEYFAQLPFSLKTKYKTPKYLLRELVYRFVPESLMNRPKKGFSIPLLKWMLGPLKDDVKATLSFKSVAASGVLNPEEVQRLVDEFYSKKLASLAVQVWYVYCFQKWHAKWGILQ